MLLYWQESTIVAYVIANAMLKTDEVEYEVFDADLEQGVNEVEIETTEE